MLKPVCHIWVCHCCIVVSVLVLLLVPLLKLLYCYLFLCNMDVFSFEFNGCYWLLWLCITFNMSKNSFFKWGMNLSHSKFNGSICTLYLLLIHIASFLTWFISSSCAFLVLTGSVKLIPPIQLLNAILPCLSTVHWHLFFNHDMLDVT